MILSELLQLKFPMADFLKDIILQDDGDGSYIREWHLVDVEQPTQEVIDQWAIELDLEYRQQQARNARRYPTWQEQMDMQYHDKLDNTTVWEDTIAAIKAAHPIPQE